MILNMRPTKDAAWYRPDGTPVYDVNLRVARKEKLYPRVSSILDVWPKPELEAWKQEQCVLAALTLPRAEGETLESFAARVVEDSRSQSKTTAEWGSGFHALICSVMLGQKPAEVPEIYQPQFEAWASWYDQNVEEALAVEQVVVNNNMGYAGRLDHLLLIEGEPTLADTKTRGVKNGKPAWYDTQAMQLAAYSRCLPAHDLNLPCALRHMSIIVNRDEPEAPYVKVWSQDEMQRAWEQFVACLNLWQLWKNYDPMV